MLLGKALGTEGTVTAKDQSRSSGEGGFDTQSGCGRISVREGCCTKIPDQGEPGGSGAALVRF